MRIGGDGFRAILLATSRGYKRLPVATLVAGGACPIIVTVECQPDPSVPESPSPPTEAPFADEAAWEQALAVLLADHFDAAHERVDSVYRRHFASPRAVLSRHWRQRRDVPRDLANLPRQAWGLLRRAAGRGAGPRRYSGKERELAAAIAEELLALPQLEQQLLALLRRHPGLDEELLAALGEQLAPYSPARARRRIERAVRRLGVTQEGGRDALIFLALGLAGRAFGDKLLFGSAAVLGAALATGFYTSQQSLLGGLWVKWFGAPGWVGASGAAGGVLVVTLLAPVIAPFVELGVNRLRGRKLLHQLVEQARGRLVSGGDPYRVAGYLGSYVPLLPDLLAALRALR